MSYKGTCPICGKGPRNLFYLDPETKQRVCQTCYQKSTGKRGPRKEGICPECGKGPRPICYLHPKKKKENIYHSCYARIKRRERGLKRVPRKKTERKLKRKILYPTRKSVEEALEARVRDGKKNNAGILIKENTSLYRRALQFKVKLPKVKPSGRKKGLWRVSRKPAELAAVKRSKRKVLYSTKESVEEALEARAKEGKRNNAKVLVKEDASLYRKALQFKVKLPKAYKSTTVRRVRKQVRLRRTPVILPSLAAKKTIKPKSKPKSELERMIRKYFKRLGEKAKYPDREAVITALEGREIQEKDNFPSVLRKEDSVLYHLALWFNVELPIEENPPVKYYPGDLVKNQNPRDPDIYGKIGKVLDVDDKKKEVRVDFKERGRITRIYRKWESFNNITLHARNPLVPAEATRKELVLV